MKKIFLITLILCAMQKGSHAQLSIGDNAPEIKLPDSLGKWKPLSEVKSKLVLLDFWAAWCGPCRMVTPILEEIASENAAGVEVVKLNVDEAPGVAQRFGIQSIPTIMLFDKGELKHRVVGALGKPQFLAEFSPFFAG